MWNEGVFELDGRKFHYKVKIMPNGYSEGIDNGRIIKLWLIYDSNDIHEALYDPLAYYDGGWIVRAKNKIEKNALEHVLNLFK